MVRFGVFDHLDASGAPLAELYEHRLRLVEAYERIGIHCYHCAEHHATTLGMAPSPSVYLAAVAQRTRRLLFGPLVYTLALYHPLRLAEEICMLDQMSGGRLQLGVGRGISPIEISHMGVDPAKAQAMYVEAFAVLTKALDSETLTFEGEVYRYRDVPIQLHPIQRPHPPLWYGIGNPAAVEWCVQNRVNIVSNAPLTGVRGITDKYRAEWAKAGNDLARIPLLATTRHMVIAETDAEAMQIARRAYRRWHASFMLLWRKHNMTPTSVFPDELDELHREARALIGSPDTVRAAIARQAEAAGINYLLCRFAFGDLTLAESMRSVELFARHVMPAFAPSRVLA